jgi:hypothetical protein
MKRQAATSKGIRKRIKNLAFKCVKDPRQGAKVKHPLPTMLTTLIMGIVTMARSLREVEDRQGFRLKKKEIRL